MRRTPPARSRLHPLVPLVAAAAALLSLLAAPPKARTTDAARGAVAFGGVVGAAKPKPKPKPTKAKKRKPPAPKKPVRSAAPQAPAEVVVAVVDTGVDVAHPELAGRLWTNRREVAGNGVDDDRNGIADDVHGADFVTATGDPGDRVGHGTHVAGIVASSGGPAARVMALKIETTGWMDFDAAARAIRYAVDQGARVINLSWGNFTVPSSVHAALAHAASRGVLVVTASGNFGQDNDLRPVFPASSTLDAVLAVGATCDGASAAVFSNVGKLSVDLVAPGCAVTSTARGGGREQRTGTSMAAPLVAGAAAALVAARPSATAPVLRRALLTGARAQPGLDAVVASGARLDLPGAIAALASPDTTAPRPFAATSPGREFEARRTDLYYDAISFSWTPSADPALAGYELVVDGAVVAGVGASRSSATVKIAPGRHSWSVVAYDRAGNRTTAGNGTTAG